MKWLTSKRQVKMIYAVAALVTTCGAAMGASDSEQFQRFQDPNQWGAPAGNLNQTRYSSLKDINTGNVKGLSMIWAQSSGTLRGHEGQPLENVGRAALDEHHRLATDILNHQRLSFMTAQGTARLRPHHTKALDVARVDVL